jgi:hypothetical protein
MSWCVVQGLLLVTVYTSLTVDGECTTGCGVRNADLSPQVLQHRTAVKCSISHLEVLSCW